MSKLKSYTCAKCGAVLDVDKLQVRMACPFCGNGFDYVEFHSEDLLRQAEECLERGAYKPAGEKFDQVLESDPKSIRAYRGLILCAARIQSTEDLRDRYDQSSSDLFVIKEIALSAKEHVTQEDKAYLESMVNLFEIPAIYKDTDRHKNETRNLERKKYLQSDMQREVQDKLMPVYVLAIAFVLGAIALVVGMFAIDGLQGGLPALLRMVPLAILAVVGCRLLKNKTAAKNIVEITESSDSLAERLDNIEDEYAEILSEVLEYEKTFMQKPEDKVIRTETRKNEPKTDTKTNVICAKCGGFLKLNNDRELYECSSCGVSYGKYLFFGDLAANALKAMELGEFDEADQILSHKLTANPKDFEALLGRFLCAGRWKSMNDIDLNDRLFASHVRRLPGRLYEIEKRITKEDQPLWEDIRKLSDLLTEYSGRIAAFNRVYEKYASVCGKLNDTILMEREIDDYKRQKDDLYKNMEQLNAECEAVGSKIAEAVSFLENAGGDCVFYSRE